MYQPESIPTDAKIRKFIRHILFGKNLFCPECKSRNIISYESRFRCRFCRRKFSLLSHTWLSNLKIPLKNFWLIIWCFTAQIPAKQAAVISGLSQKAVRYWYSTFRNNLPKEKVILEANCATWWSLLWRMERKSSFNGKTKRDKKISLPIIPNPTSGVGYFSPSGGEPIHPS